MAADLLTHLPTLLCVLLVLLAGWHDVSGYRIPNWSVLGIAGLFALQLLVQPALLALLGWHVLLALVVFGAGFGLFLGGWLGAGDGKLLAALALWAGPGGILPLLLVTSFAGGALSLAIWLAASRPLPVRLEGFGFTGGYRLGLRRVPYGLAIGAGGLAVLLPQLIG